MLTTIQIKPPQLAYGTYRTGTGPLTVLIMGSCRTIPYLNYFHFLNENNHFTIHFLDPFNWNWDAEDRRVDYMQAITKMESNPDLLNTLRSVKWFIHEHYQNFGMFNTDRSNQKNIYQFGINPELDLSIPNFHDVFILFHDFLKFNAELRAMAVEDVRTSGLLSKELQSEIFARGQKNIIRFYENCRLTNFPEMEGLFRENWKRIRYFWSMNHVSCHYTTAIFKWMIDTHLHLSPSDSFWHWAHSSDQFASVITPLTKYDVANYGILWDGPVQDLNPETIPVGI